MKKRISIILFAVLVITSVMPLTAFAADSVSDLPPAVVDGAGLLSDSEESDLADQLDELRAQYNVDVCIVTADHMNASDQQTEADLLFDNNGYGLGDDRSGIMYYVCMNPRVYQFSTRGEAITIFTDYGLEKMDDNCFGYLSSGEYYTAFQTYINECEELLQYYEENGTAYDVSGSESSGNPLMAVAIGIVAALVIAFVLTAIRCARMNTAVAKVNAASYEKNGSFKLRASRDMFLYSTVSRVAKPKENNSGGSSTHMTGGVSHGGRGGSF